MRGLALSFNNTLYIADKDNHRIQRWSIGVSSGSTVAGRADGVLGNATNELSGPTGTALDSNGNIYVADSGNHRVVFWAIEAPSGTVVAGDGKRSCSIIDFEHIFYQYDCYTLKKKLVLYRAMKVHHFRTNLF